MVKIWSAQDTDRASKTIENKSEKLNWQNKIQRESTSFCQGAQHHQTTGGNLYEGQILYKQETKNSDIEQLKHGYGRFIMIQDLESQKFSEEAL